MYANTINIVTDSMDLSYNNTYKKIIMNWYVTG